MAAAGIASPFPIDDLAIIGVNAIPRRLPMILRRIRETADAIVAARPDAVVIIDSPDFTHRVARRVRARAPSIPIIDYVSPSVWAWRPGRARAMRDYVDCVLAILPFEPAAHLRLGGPPCVYVGHPLTERLSRAASRCRMKRVRRQSAIRRSFWCSRAAASSEIRRLLSIFGDALRACAAPHRAAWSLCCRRCRILSRKRAPASPAGPVTPRIVVDPAEKWAAFRPRACALAASGTVTLELALAGVPTVAAYKVTLIEELIARLVGLQKALTSVILANLVIGENVVPEFLQRDCTPQRLADALVPLFSDTPERLRQVDAFARLDGIMQLDAAPSAKAAAIVLDIARHGRRDLAGAPYRPK